MLMWFSTIFLLGAPVTASVHVCSPCSLFSVSCWWRCLRWAKWCAFSYAVSCCRLLFRCSRWINFKSAFSLQRCFGGNKSSTLRICSFSCGVQLALLCVCCSASFAFIIRKLLRIHRYYKNIVLPTMNKKLDSSVSYSHPHNLNRNNSLFLLL